MAKLIGYVFAGEKIGDTAKVQCFAGVVVAKLSQQFRSQAYENCVKKSGKTKCDMKYKEVPRGFELEEFNKIMEYLFYQAKKSIAASAVTSMVSEGEL